MTVLSFTVHGRFGRQVTLSEIISDLLAEHDKAMEAEPR